ncbi:MAG: hypothetical protein D6736_02415 [Nitrospinota bacterium]|nr:MAG: hypothetical protein D6736_02415 [Nitrospinota bacterium]
MGQERGQSRRSRHRRRGIKPLFWLVGLPLLLLIGLAGLYAFNRPASSPGILTEAEEAFLARHWQQPLPPQGPPPPNFSPLEASLAPASCGTCHPQQYQDWQTSIHSQSMGPGVWGQVIDMIESDPASAQVCWSCHTPLAEQQNVLLVTSPQGEATFRPNPAFDAALQQQGLVCAACHVRKHQRFGPPRRTTPAVTGRINGNLPHGGFMAETAFTKSAFCRGCHQFGADGFALNGKLLENTYQEWQQSSYPDQGIACQDCHMPERRHLWRGIHDPEMVKRGVTITVDVPEKRYKKGETLEAIITVANTGVGHYFPTYVTPKVFVRGHLLTSEGTVLPETAQEAIIGREVTLDLSQELYDTRIPPGESSSFAYRQTLPRDRLQLRVEVVVAPDHFYTRFFAATLNDGGGGKGRSLLVKALENARRSPFTIYVQTIPLYVP